MNFLGHLYFSNNNATLQVANLFGDFVKGSDLSTYPESVQEGIILHRQIDTFIDHHPAVLELLRELYPHLPKVSGIAVDLYFDHLLARNWSDYHPTPLREFTSQFYLACHELPEHYPIEFRFVLAKMEHDDWLYEYRNFSGLVMACSGLSKRIRFQNNLHKAPEVFLNLKERIEEVFDHFMQDAILKFQSK
jgi:acyl carrier protein phosphodiesterase